MHAPVNIPKFFIVPLIVLNVEIRVLGSWAVAMAPSVTGSVDVTVSIPVFVVATPVNPVVSFLYKNIPYKTREIYKERKDRDRHRA